VTALGLFHTGASTRCEYSRKSHQSSFTIVYSHWRECSHYSTRASNCWDSRWK